mmetsp:Transcript_39821/g.78283  ORF Transcript_39821/g.78283 Transcript_39821/m.78283 type:complete len:294 (-) Transcript_39821:1702-2583(-)
MAKTLPTTTKTIGRSLCGLSEGVFFVCFEPAAVRSRRRRRRAVVQDGVPDHTQSALSKMLQKDVCFQWRGPRQDFYWRQVLATFWQRSKLLQEPLAERKTPSFSLNKLGLQNLLRANAFQKADSRHGLQEHRVNYPERWPFQHFRFQRPIQQRRIHSFGVRHGNFYAPLLFGQVFFLEIWRLIVRQVPVVDHMASLRARRRLCAAINTVQFGLVRGVPSQLAALKFLLSQRRLGGRHTQTLVTAMIVRSRPVCDTAPLLLHVLKADRAFALLLMLLLGSCSVLQLLLLCCQLG